MEISIPGKKSLYLDDHLIVVSSGIVIIMTRDILVTLA